MFKQILSTIGVKAFSAIANFSIVIITAQFFGAEGRGYISLIIAAISLVLMFSNFIGGTTLTYLVSRENISNLILTSYVWIISVSSVAFILINYLQLMEDEENTHIFFLSMLFALTAINQNILLGYQKIKKYNIITVVQSLVQIISLVVYLYIFKEKNISVFITTLYISYGLAFILSCFFISKYLQIPLRTDIMQVAITAFQFGAIAQLANLFQFISYRYAYVVLNNPNNQTDVGIYSTAVSISEAVWLISGAISIVQYSKISNTEDPKVAQELTLKLSKFSLLLTVLAIAFLLLLPDTFYVFLFGKDFTGVKAIMLTLTMGIVSLGYSIVFSHYFSGLGKYYVNTIVSFVGMIVTIVLSKLLIPKYGIPAAGWISSVTYLLGTICLVVYFLYQSKINVKRLFVSSSDIVDFKNILSNVWNSRIN
jgi:O-antigen/teichoic acid export membrane protein